MCVILGVLLLTLIYGVSIFNKLVRSKMLVEEAWSAIDVQLKKRYDLVPNLVNTVKGYATHEKSTFEAVISARSQAMSADSPEAHQEAENTLSRTLRSLFAVAESYPELKADRAFLSLQDSLNQIELDLEKSRRYYNGTARDRNVLIQSFPSNIIAGMFSHKPAPFFELDTQEERHAPVVSF
ncbi:membrane protein [Porphyromonas crevioricanis]|uniref:Membrane protein n=1 Tax=Porphyromonas crevioricanis TaxID=393921 RepID=A0AB34PH91_9PORP|nr:membrane protein [Porphyromonas crevioricanis]KGN94152.1 membrane protein [Porphyromonas crevioricanis]